uniref:dockerin type I domain-containing protein n=1 Tax=Candidatus Onthocola sp. TaxID=3085646 RepID=UPI003FEEC2BD
MENKKTKIISIVSLIALAITLITATYAYFAAQTGEGASTDIKINANTTDVFTFETGSAISISLNQENFASGTGNQSGTTYAKAMLTANNKTNTATGHYYLYLNIKSNSFVYSQDNTKPEILLKITDKNGVEVKPTLEGLEYKTITDGKGVSQSGYDITTYNDVLPIYENKEITTTSSITEQWNITITFINYDFNQSANAGKSLSATLMIQKSELEYTLGDLNGDGKINAIEKLYFRKYFSNLMSFNKYQLKAADVNEDGVVDDIDYDIVNAVLEKKLTTLPYKNTDVYNITYNLDGGTITDYLKTKYTSNFASSLIGVVTKENYGFTGWTGSNGDTPETNVTIAQGTTGDLNYTANWALLGDINQDGEVDVFDNTALSHCLNKLSCNSNYRNDVADVNRDGKIDFLDLDNLRSFNLGLIPITYMPDKIYNITYDLDGGKFLNSSGTKYDARSRYYQSDNIIKLDEPTKDGYTFLGWTGSNGSTPETSVTIAANTTGDLHYKANWQAN